MTEYIHILWAGPIKLKDAYLLKNERTDYGIYQVYGRHPIAGMTALLYIGKAEEQVFGVRLKQENWETWEEGEGPVEIRVGRLAGGQTPSDEHWGLQIRLAESLLISANKPPRNGQGVAWLSAAVDPACHRLHVLNWGSYGAILPEVSGARWSSLFDSIPGFRPYEWRSRR